MAFIDRRNNAFYRYWLYEKLSEAHAAAGDYEQALFYFRLYHSEFVNIFDVERERAISELHVQYETEKQKREFHEKEVALLRQRQKTNITLCITLFSLESCRCLSSVSDARIAVIGRLCSNSTT